MTFLSKFSLPESACVYPPSWYQPPVQTPDEPVNPLGIQEPVSEPYSNDLNDVLAG